MAAIEMPTGIWNSKVFRIAGAQQLNPAGQAGFIQTLNRSSPFWVAEYTTPPLSGDRYNTAIVFFDQLEGSMNRFLATDPRRPMPYAYRNLSTNTQPWGAVRMFDQDYANSLVKLDNFIPGSFITQGDLISVQVAGIWYLFRSQVTTQADQQGVSWIQVKPRPNIANFTPTVIRYVRACMEMKLVGDVTETDSVDDIGTSFKLQAAQFTNRTGQ